MEKQAIHLMGKFGLFTEQWQPKVIAEMNDYQFKVVRLQGDFVWHAHADTDETFLVLEGEMRIDFRDGTVRIGGGRDVCGSEGRGAQAVCGEGSEADAD